VPDDETLVRQRLLGLWPRPLSGAEADFQKRDAAGPAQAEVQAVEPEEAVEAAWPAEPGRDAGPARAVEVRPPAEPALPLPGRGDAAAVRRLGGAGAFDPGRRGVRALAAVAVAVVLAAAGWAWWARPRAEPVSPGPVAPLEDAPVVAAPAVSSPTGEVVVAVAGRVRRPGLVRLPAGARVADALAAAGGVLPGTDAALLNLARRVTDGELIVVGATPPPAAAQAGSAPSGAAAPVNLNTATLAQLDGLPGVGPVLAQRILDHREQHGGFRSVGELRQVDGIGDARYEQLKDLVTV
jgi:competence protein ComEA